MPIDPDDKRPDYQQIADQMRAAILTRTFEPGQQLPTQEELATRYVVARETVKRGLDILKAEGLVFSRQGKGTFVRERPEKPVGLRPHIERAFAEKAVTIDFSGYTAETLHGAIAEPLDKVRSGRLTPESIRIRLLLSDLTQPLAVPVATEGGPEVNVAVRKRMANISTRHAGAIAAAIEELADLSLVPEATVETRVHGSAPLFKAYVINGSDAFFGYYPIVEHEVRLGTDRQAIYDPMGKDAVMFHYVHDGDPDSTGSQFLRQTVSWFESVWNTIAVPVP